MFCKECGKELSANEKYCPNCGTPSVTPKEATVLSSLASVPEKKQTNATAAGSGTSASRPKLTTKTIMKRLLLAGMICFIFPFTTVSCSGEAFTFSGVEAMTAVTTQDNPDLSEIGPNIFLIAAFILAAAALAVLCRKKSSSLKAPAIMATIGAVCEILFRTTFVSYYGLEEVKEAISINFRWGWLLSFVGYAGTAAVAWFEILQVQKNIGNEPPPPTASIKKSSQAPTDFLYETSDTTTAVNSTEE